MFDYDDDYDALADLDDAKAEAFEALSDEERESYFTRGCRCGNCCSCLGISEKDFQ